MRAYVSACLERWGVAVDQPKGHAIGDKVIQTLTMDLVIYKPDGVISEHASLKYLYFKWDKSEGFFRLKEYEGVVGNVIDIESFLELEQWLGALESKLLFSDLSIDGYVVRLTEPLARAAF